MPDHCCFIDDGVELAQEIPGISCLLVEGLANIQGEPLTSIDDACVALKTVSESVALVSSVSETWLYNPVEFTKIVRLVKLGGIYP